MNMDNLINQEFQRFVESQETPLTDAAADHPDGCDPLVSTEHARDMERRAAAWEHACHKARVHAEVAEGKAAGLREAIANALVPLRAADNPPQMKREEFLERCRVVAINILKKGLES